MYKKKGITRHQFEDMEIGKPKVIRLSMADWRKKTNCLRTSAAVYGKVNGFKMVTKADMADGTVTVTKYGKNDVVPVEKKKAVSNVSIAVATERSLEKSYMNGWRKLMNSIRPIDMVAIIEKSLKTNEEKERAGSLFYWDFLTTKNCRELFKPYLDGNAWLKLSDEESINALVKIGYPRKYITEKISGKGA